MIADRPVAAQISDYVVRIHAKFYGRGPKSARTVWSGNVIVCQLEDIYTRAEETLIERGQFETVRRTRQSFQDSVEPLLRAEVESLTGHRVRGFFSQISRDASMAVEVFVLESDISSSSA